VGYEGDGYWVCVRVGMRDTYAVYGKRSGKFTTNTSNDGRSGVAEDGDGRASIRRLLQPEGAVDSMIAAPPQADGTLRRGVVVQELSSAWQWETTGVVEVVETMVDEDISIGRRE